MIRYWILGIVCLVLVVEHGGIVTLRGHEGKKQEPRHRAYVAGRRLRGRYWGSGVREEMGDVFYRTELTVFSARLESGALNRLADNVEL